MDEYDGIIEVFHTGWSDLASNLLGHGWKLLKIMEHKSTLSSIPYYVLGRTNSVNYTLEEAQRELEQHKKIEEAKKPK